MNVTLYIAHHNQMDIKYFGKTTKYHTQEDLQRYYHGSGTVWNNYWLEVYGDDVTMELYGTFNINEVEAIALKFSKDNDIVESTKWANKRYENGLDGVLKGAIPWNKGKTGLFSHSEASKENLRFKMLGKIFSAETRAKMSIAQSKENNPMWGRPKTDTEKENLSKKSKIWHKENKYEVLQHLNRINNDENINQRRSDTMRKKYTDDDYLEKFTEMMTEVNSRPEKREKAGKKIKERWKDPIYIEKMRNRPKPNHTAIIQIINKKNDIIEFEGLNKMCSEMNLNMTIVREYIDTGLPVTLRPTHKRNEKNLNTEGLIFKNKGNL